MFEAFSGRARSVVERAHDESRRLGHPHVGTEHLLLGLLVEEGGPPAAVLAGAGVTVGACRRKVAEAVAGSAGRNAPGTALTPRASRALERAFRFSRQYRGDHVEPEHVLLAVLDVEGTAGQVLRGLGVDVGGLRGQVEGLAEGGNAPAPAPVASDPSPSPAEEAGPGTATVVEARGGGSAPGRPAEGPAPGRPAEGSAEGPAEGPAPGAARPRCPSCGAALPGALAHRVVASWGETGPPLPVLVVYCSGCDTALGASPA